jgi:acyl-coenzyme A synthetase/AMP-(fatty) acid ligase
VVADGDGRDHDCADSGRGADQAGLGDAAVLRHSAGGGDKEGEPVPAGSGGLLVVRKPWPSMARTVYGDPERYQKTYWSDVPGCYFTGDGARRMPTATSG